MSDVCPSCGQIIKSASDADALLVLLTEGAPHREVYRAQNGSGWYVTRGGGQWSEEAVMRLVQSGPIRSVYRDCPGDAYHVGKTLDIPATLAARKCLPRKEWPRVFTDGTLCT